MKKIYLLALLSTCLSLSIFANGVKINGIYYLLDNSTYTASVTYTGSSYSTNRYSGGLVIPTSVEYNSHIYSVTNIDDFAFYGCSSLTSVTIPNSVTSIGESAFYNCIGLTSVTIPNSVTSIGDYAFLSIPNIVYAGSAIGSPWGARCINGYIDGCLVYSDNTETTLLVCFTTAQGEIIIPNSVTSIGSSAFSSCIGLTSVTIPNSVISIGEYAFLGCSSLTSVTIPNSVTSIENGTFQSCTGLTSITIPNSVTSFGTVVFDFCESLTSIEVEWENTRYDSRNNCNAIIETATNTLIAGCKNTAIPNSVTSIGSSAFSSCIGLTSIVIPNSVTSIGSGAFSHCTGLTALEIPSSVTNIGNSLFFECTALTSITIPNSVTIIENYAFYGCSKLDTVICKTKTPPALGTNVFDNISHTAVLLVPYESIDAYKAIDGYTNSFAEIKGFSDVEDITDTTATLKWIPDTAVAQYDIKVYTSDTLFAHYVVDGNGQIVSSQRFAPSIYHQKMDSTTSSTDYFVISLNGLSAGTDYTYTIDGTNAQNVPVYHEGGSFTTLNEGEEGFFEATTDDPNRQVKKILRNGQLFILRNGKTYTLNGIEI